MYVPQPLVVANRGSELLRGDPLHWTILRTEWKTLIFGLWLAEVRFHGLLWRLPTLVRGWVTDMVSRGF